jgi:hypothetical protein
MNAMKTLTHEDAGCWIDGHHGQYTTPMMLRIAVEYGWDGLDDAEKDAMMRWLNGLDFDGDEVENLMDAVDEAEAWLNENVAPDGYSFGWHDGEFFLMRREWWMELDDLIDELPSPDYCRMSKKEAIERLTWEGNLKVPASRYGRDSETCAEVTWRMFCLIEDESPSDDPYAALHYMMSLVVNDHDDVEALVLRHYGLDEEV